MAPLLLTVSNWIKIAIRGADHVNSNVLFFFANRKADLAKGPTIRLLRGGGGGGGVGDFEKKYPASAYA